MVIENHGDFAESLFLQRKVPLPALTRRLMRGLSSFALARADVLRAVSGFTAEQVRRRRPDLPLVQFIAYTDSQAFAQAGAERAEPPSRSTQFAFVGALIPRKGVHVLLDAFAQLDSSASLLLIGKAENADYAAQLHAQVNNLGLAKRVTFIEFLQHAEVAAHLTRSRALILPSVSEGLGLVVVEAMLCGLPVIGSDTGGIPDMVTPEQTGWLVTPNDADSLAAALQNTLTDGAQTDRTGVQARAFALDFTDPQRYLEGHQQMLFHARAALTHKR
jgi:glycosyltransferase involved in cell wall biosynthesis